MPLGCGLVGAIEPLMLCSLETQPQLALFIAFLGSRPSGSIAGASAQAMRAVSAVHGTLVEESACSFSC